MKRYYRFILAALIFIGSSCVHDAAFSYVLSGRHIIDIAVKREGRSANLMVKQRLTLPRIGPSRDDLTGGTIVEKDIEPVSTENGASAQYGADAHVDETLYYMFSNKIRSEIDHDNIRKITLFAEAQTAQVLDGRIFSWDENPLDIYKKILLFRNPHLLETYLSTLGVDVGSSSLGRFSGKIVFIIGAFYPDESASQLWFDKETFQPVRCLVRGGVTEDFETLEFIFSDWRKIEKVSYPWKTVINRNGIPYKIIQVEKVEKNAQLSDGLFSMKYLKSLYPESGLESYKGVDEKSDVEKSIDDFKKMFE